MHEHLYIISYDISDNKRWRQVFKAMQGYGEWLQLSMFQCRLRRERVAELAARLEEMIHHGQDHVLIVDLGPADAVKPRITSLGKAFAPVERKPVII